MFWNSRVEPLDLRQAPSDSARAVRPALSHDALQIARRHANRRQRRPQVVAERRQQRRLQPSLAAPEQLGAPSAIFKATATALDRDGGDAAERVQRARLDRALPAVAISPTALAPIRSGTRPTVCPGRAHTPWRLKRPVAGEPPRVGTRSERAFGVGKCLGKLPPV